MNTKVITRVSLPECCPVTSKKETTNQISTDFPPARLLFQSCSRAGERNCKESSNQFAWNAFRGCEQFPLGGWASINTAKHTVLNNPPLNLQGASSPQPCFIRSMGCQGNHRWATNIHPLGTKHATANHAIPESQPGITRISVARSTKMSRIAVN